MGARKYVRDARGRFATVRAGQRQKAAVKRVPKIEKANAKARQHTAKAKIWERRLGYDNELSSFHTSRAANQYGKAGRMQAKQKRAGYNLRGEKISKPKGRLTVATEARKRKKYQDARKREGLKVQAATGVSVRQQQRQRANVRKAAKSLEQRNNLYHDLRTTQNQFTHGEAKEVVDRRFPEHAGADFGAKPAGKAPTYRGPSDAQTNAYNAKRAAKKPAAKKKSTAKKRTTAKKK